MGPSREEKLLAQDVKELEKEMQKITMQSNYVEYVKIERKKVALERKIEDIKSSKSIRNLVIKFGLPYGCQGVLTLLLILTSFYHRSTPVIVFDSNLYDFTPFNFILKFPTGINGAISVPVWIIVSSFVSRTIAGFIKT